MIVSILYILLALFGLSFLIFIHELGHYWTARHVGMRVETFSIGFGKPIYSWVRNGVRWQIGWLLFGGFVKIAGTETDSKEDLYKIHDGFFGKKPIDRIKVAFMGPFVNLVFAMLVFTLLWATGGREKNFTEFTHKIGWVDPKSELFSYGIRPGDEVISYNNKPFQGAQDHFQAPTISGGDLLSIKGYKVDYTTGKKVPFEYKIHPYHNASYLDKDILTAGITQPARYIIYDRLNGKANPLPDGSSLNGTGIEYGDRVIWAGGELIFSEEQLRHILNDNDVLLTVARGQDTLLRRVPRVQVQELRPDPEFREELIDWQYASGISTRKTQDLYVIPYNLTHDGVVENPLKFIDQEHLEQIFPEHPFSEREAPLQKGDKIIAVNGFPVQHSAELLSQLQKNDINIIVERDPKAIKEVSWKDADNDFYSNINWEALNTIVQSIGEARPVTDIGNLHLLPAVTAKKRNELQLSPEKQAWLATEFQEKKKMIDKIEDPARRAEALRLLDKLENELVLGLPYMQDRHVVYNPKPTQLFSDVVQNIWQLLTGLATLSLSPKYILGPVGIVQAVQVTGMSVGIKEAIYWLGMISLNLGMLNLLPIPVLDGGTIMLSLFEMISGRKLQPKTLEKLIIPFALLLIAFFVYVTYNDLARIFGKMIPW